MLIDPGIVARLGAVLSKALESGARILVECPALGAMIAGRLRSVKRAFALTPIETAQMPARQRYPDYALAVDVSAANAEARHRHSVDFGERRFRRKSTGHNAHDRAGIGPPRSPNRAIDRARQYSGTTRDEP